MSASRRIFLKVLAAFPFLGSGMLARPEQPNRVALNEFAVAGLRFHAPPELLRSLRPGEAIEVSAERENPYDEFAVRVDYRGRQIGYMPRDQNRTVALLLRQQVPVAGVITAVDPEAVPWEAVRVGVFAACFFAR